MNSKSGLILTLCMALFLTACGPKKTPEAPVAVDDGADATNGLGYDPETGNQWGIPGFTQGDLDRLGFTENPLNFRVVYFEYNSSSVNERSRAIIAAHAHSLNQTGGAQVSLEGHADERGTRDYNLALGERRAQEVSRLMQAGGAGSSSIQTISYGEERPADTGHNDAAWQKNRRVAINY